MGEWNFQNLHQNFQNLHHCPEVVLFKEMAVDRMAAATQKAKTATNVKNAVKAVATKMAQEHWIIQDGTMVKVTGLQQAAIKNVAYEVWVL